MGCASWRVRHRYREYSALAPAGGAISGGPKTRPTFTSVEPWGLNEVGVTDGTMVTLWKAGPNGASYAVTSGAESQHLGADIALVHRRTNRILLYQAKLARLERGVFRLKSVAPAAQVRRLRRRSVVLSGVQYAVTSRFALYQIDDAPFLQHCFLEPLRCWRPWSWESVIVPRPQIGRDYYKDVLRHGPCSPSGILAAPVVGREAVTSIRGSLTWPWEFDAHEWLGGSSRLDSSEWPSDAATADEQNPTPEFRAYEPQGGRAAADGIADDAVALADQLRLPARWMLNVVSI